MSFQQFVDFVLSQANREEGIGFQKMNVHWRPISAHGFFCHINYTVISKIETYNEDKKMFLKMVGIEERMKEERIHVTAGESIRDETKTMFKKIRQEDREALKELYKYDFELFDYDPEMY